MDLLNTIYKRRLVSPELDDCARFLSGGLLFCTGCVVVVVVVCGVGSAIAWICQCVQIVNQT